MQNYRGEISQMNALPFRERWAVGRVFENIHEAFLIVDSDLRIVVASAFYKALTHQSHLNVVGHRLNSRRHKFHSANVIESLKKSLAENRDLVIEDYNIETNMWLEYHMSPHPLGVSSFIFDVTEKKEVELRNSLQAEPSLLLLEGLDCGVARVGLNGLWLSLNARCAELTGYSSEVLRNRYFWELFVSGCRTDDHNSLKALIRGERANFIVERQLIKADQIKMWVSVKVTLVRSICGSPKFFAVVIEDIADRKDAEERLTFALDAAEMGNWDYDVLADSLRRSPRFNQIFGYEKNAPAHWGYSDFIAHVHPDDKLQVENQLKEVFSKQKKLSLRCRIIRPTRDLRWISLLGRVKTDSKGRIFRVVGLVSDITSEKLAVEDLENAKLAAEDAHREKSYFLANMSHEIRTPLGAILGFTEMLKEGGLSEGDREEYLQIVTNSGKNLAGLIENILDFSKVEAGYLNVENQPVDVLQVLKEVKVLLQTKADVKALDFTFSSENPFRGKVKTDHIRLRQILLNVIGNAIKFTDSGFVRVSTENILSQDNHVKLIFSVKDSGSGISEQDASKLFNPFTQVDNSMTRKFGGSGLGLALSRQIARALGGDLELVSSEKGKGSTFVVSISAEILPSEDQAIRTEEVSLQKAPLSKKPLSLDGVKILVADDSPENQHLFRHLLVRVGALVDSAENGRIAVERVQEKIYDVVLMDMQMPELDGYEATQKIREKGMNIPVIALTAHAMKHDREKCLRSGCTEYLSKPVDPSKLFSLVNQVVRH